MMVCVTGVSGSGKSTLINDTLYHRHHRQPVERRRPRAGALRIHRGLEHFDKVVDVDQAPIGRTPRSNPATYTGLFTPIRELFAGTVQARERGYEPGRFSFNVKGGRCEACQGDGMIKVEMHFLPDIYVPCDVCHGQRYNRETLEVQYKGKNIHEILQPDRGRSPSTSSTPCPWQRKLQTLMDVGLTYIRLGQAATTLSGGEAQRVKLALELSKRDTGRTLYILDEPTTGLHFHDIDMLLKVLHRLRGPRQHRGGHRAQPGRDQDRRLGHRSGTGGGRRGRANHRGGDAGDGVSHTRNHHREAEQARLRSFSQGGFRTLRGHSGYAATGLPPGPGIPRAAHR
jgi:excinuclease ABC subunit A